MKRLLTSWVVVAAVGLFLSGCNSNSRIIATGLSVEITAIEPLADGTVKVSWQVVNPNIVPYLFSELDLSVSINGISLGKLKERSPLPAPPTSQAGRTSTLKPSAETFKRLASAGKTTARYEVDTKLTILIYGDTTETAKLSNRGTVAIK